MLAGLAFILLAFSLYQNLGISPLRLEEPRRALIALEMVYNKNLIVPTIMGEFYYSKPPLFNWVIVAAYKLFGNYSEFTCRFFSTSSFLLMGILLFLLGKRYVNLPFGIYSSLLFLISGDIYYYFSMIGEIDLFYSLLTFGSFAALFHFHQSKRYYLLFLVTYSLGALGTIAKGFPSIVFLVISIPVFFIYFREPKKLVSLPHLSGITIYLIIVVGYFGLYAQYHALDKYIQALWFQSSERTVLGQNNSSLIIHLLVFPLETLLRNLPASLLIIFACRKDFLKQIESSRFIEFSFLILLSNVIVYWISPGTRSRYIYMLYPFITIILTYFYLWPTSSRENRLKAFQILVRAIVILVTALCCSLPFISQLKPVGNLTLVAVLLSIVCVALCIVSIKKLKSALLVLVFAMIIIRFVFNLTILPLRAIDSEPQTDKENAFKISEITSNNPLYIYRKSRFGLTTVFYIAKERKEVLCRKYEPTTDDFFLADKKILENQSYEIFYSFQFRSDYYEDAEIVLIKFTNLTNKGR